MCLYQLNVMPVLLGCLNFFLQLIFRFVTYSDFTLYQCNINAMLTYLHVHAFCFGAPSLMTS